MPPNPREQPHSTHITIHRRMGRGLTSSQRALATRLLLSGMSSNEVASTVGCCIRTIGNYNHNLKEHGSCLAPQLRRIGRPPGLTDDDMEALFQSLVQDGWRSYKEMKVWVGVERGVEVSNSTICRELQKRKWNSKSFKGIATRRRNQEKEEMRNRGEKSNTESSMQDVTAAAAAAAAAEDPVLLLDRSNSQQEAMQVSLEEPSHSSLFSED